MTSEYIEFFYNLEFNANDEDLFHNNTTAGAIPYTNENIGSKDKKKHNLMELTIELHRIDQTPESPKHEDISLEIKFQIDEIEPSLPSIFQDTLSKLFKNPSPTIPKINTDHSTSLKRKRSRSNKMNTKNTLLIFHDNPNSRMKNAKVKDAQKKKEREYPKKEYYRIKCIRKWKKYLRKLRKNQKFEFMENFKKHYGECRKELDVLALTEKGPKTEAKNRRVEMSQYKSYNNECVKILFQKNSSKESFKLFIIDYFEAKKRFSAEAGNEGENNVDMFFFDAEKWCCELCQTFKFDCCKSVLHNKDCELKWLKLMEYTYSGLILNNEPQL